MWFKTVRLYRLSPDFVLPWDALEDQLAAQIFQPCGKSEAARVGWVSPLGRDGELLSHRLGDCVMFCLRKEERLLPSAVVNEAVQEKIDEIEDAQDRKVYRKEKLQLKDDVIATLMPRAFTRNRVLFAYLDLKQKLMVVNTGSAAAAEELISTLRESLGSLPLSLLDVNNAPMAVMTQWLRDHKATDHFVIDQDCELINPMEEGNVVRARSQDLTADEIRAHLDAGKQVKKLGVVWNDAVACVINADLSLSRLRFEDMVLEQARESDPESAAQQFDQDFAIMSLTLAGMFDSLFAAFGGLTES
ncbi:MAG: recombination-associated protein RdgC [Pseudohongiella sp.]|nr:recombination-associated protein RdgC [Pseudohongiella sp.]MDP2127917.1 recombination-associated protein RdgC [Pseudohongiella sp.]